MGVPVDQQGLGRAADAGPARLGVQRHPPRHLQVGRGIDIDMAVAVEMGDHRDAAFLLHPGDQPLAAARHDDVDMPVHAQHGADRRPVGRRDELDRILRQAGFAEAVAQAVDDRSRGVEALPAAAEDGRVAGFQAQRAGVGGHVRPRFVDDADHAERRAHPGDAQAVRPVPLGGDAADRVGQGGDLRHPGGHRLDPVRREGQAVDEGAVEVPARSLLQIARIGGEQLVLPRAQGRSRSRQGRVLRRFRRAGHHRRRGARPLAEREHLFLDCVRSRHGVLQSGPRGAGPS